MAESAGAVREVAAEDWDGRDLSGEQFTEVAFVDVDMTETTSNGAVFDRCRFTDVELNAALHTSSAFTNCTFVRCSFFGATFSQCKFLGSSFERCSFGAFTVTGGDWSFSALPGANLSKARFADVRLREADLCGARFDGATLTGADLSGARLHETNLTRCDLRGSDVSTLDPATTVLTNAIVDVAQAVVIAGRIGLDVRPVG